MAVIEIEKHFSQIGIRQCGFVASGKFRVRMTGFSKMFGHLIFSPGIILEVFRVFRVNCVQLPFRRRVEHQWTNEELGKPIQSVDKGVTGNLKMEIGLLLRSVGI
jgi:hypothetical protein